MSDITAIDQSYHLNYNIEIGKFTCLAPDTTVSADGCNVPSGANGAFLGVAQESDPAGRHGRLFRRRVHAHQRHRLARQHRSGERAGAQHPHPHLRDLAGGGVGRDLRAAPM